MLISIVNHSNGQVSDEELQVAIRAINRQIHEDFFPYWGLAGSLRLEGRSTEHPEKIVPPDLRGDAVIYLWDQTDVENAIGYHFQNDQGLPYGFVFTEIARQIGEPWSVTLSHEALELLGDPETNLLVIGPHPAENRDVFHWYEMCDAVQAETYEIDGVAVSNFVLPLYFTGTRETDEVGARNDFLTRAYEGATLTSFGINPGGYVGFFDPASGDHDTYSKEGDALAKRRFVQKGRAKEARRAVRYRQAEEREKVRRLAVKRSAKPVAGRDTVAAALEAPAPATPKGESRYRTASLLAGAQAAPRAAAATIELIVQGKAGEKFQIWYRGDRESEAADPAPIVHTGTLGPDGTAKVSVPRAYLLLGRPGRRGGKPLQLQDETAASKTVRMAKE